MTLIIEKNAKGEYFVANLVKKGAVPDYKEMHKDLVSQLGLVKEKLAREEQNKKTILNDNADILFENAQLKSLLLSILGHWANAFLPAHIKARLKNIASTVKKN